MKEDIIKKIQAMQEKINNKMNIMGISVQVLNFNYNDGLLIIRKGEDIDRIFVLKASSSIQVQVIENKKVLENGLFIDWIDKWIYNLYNPVEYMYVFIGGKLNNKTLDREEIEKIAIGRTKDYTQEYIEGNTVPRKELWNQPIVKDYVGPMLENIDYAVVFLSYETQDEYNMRSI